MGCIDAMKVVIAIDSFKESASSLELAKSIEEGIKKVYPKSHVVSVPIADGGEGTLEALGFGEKKETIILTCKDPLMRSIKASYTILNSKTALIEMASVSGLALVELDKRDPSITTTYGLGELIKDAIQKGIREFIVGIGGSATNDAGLGMLRALGFVFLDALGAEVCYAKDLSRIVKIDKTNVLKELDRCKFWIACDVKNPLYGKNGAAYVYAKQKGADDAMIEELDKNLCTFATFVDDILSHQEGCGAAGGLGYGFLAFLNAKLQSGIELLLKKSNFEEEIRDADFVITGEGCIDAQSLMGKVCDGIGLTCKKQNIPCIALSGNIENVPQDIHEKGINAVFCIQDAPKSLQEAIQKHKTLELISKKTQEIFRLILVAKGEFSHTSL